MASAKCQINDLGVFLPGDSHEQRSLVQGRGGALQNKGAANNM